MKPFLHVYKEPVRNTTETCISYTEYFAAVPPLSNNKNHQENPRLLPTQLSMLLLVPLSVALHILFRVKYSVLLQNKKKIFGIEINNKIPTGKKFFS